MTTTATKHLQLEKRPKDQPCRPDRNTPVDKLFEELILDANLVKGLLAFAADMYAEKDGATVDTSAVMVFLEALRAPMNNVADSITYILYELNFREEQGRA